MLRTRAFVELAITSAAVSLGGCFGPGNIHPSELTAGERAVHVHYQGEKPDCRAEELGVVEATSGTAVEMGTFSSTVAKLQREAARLGATAIVIIDHSKNGVADHGTAKAIRCIE
jgi:hypothetical protein